MNFKVVNNTVGWIVGAIAAITYISTAESSASLWDCGEFISAAYKLQVVHPPGAPLFLMMGRIFALFSGESALDPVLGSQVPVMLNYFSAISTAFAVLFIFWVITALAKKLIVKNGDEPDTAQTIAIIGSGLVGALAATFSDTMWFSAVEGEVYALSTFFIAIVLWAMMKWEANADKPGGNRWLLFISFMIGLSIGVHLLSLLVIPVTVMLYYFKKYKPTPIGTVVAFFTGFLVLQLVQVGIIQGMTYKAAISELFVINTLRLPFNTGIAFYYLVVIVFIFSILRISRLKVISRADIFVMLCLFFMIASKNPLIGLSMGLVGVLIFYAFNLKHDIQGFLYAFPLAFWIGAGIMVFVNNNDADVVKVILGFALLQVPQFLIWEVIKDKKSILKGRIKKHGLSRASRLNYELFGLAFLFIMIGFSSYVMIPIRSAANTPINMNAPKDAFSLLSYLNREQYGDRPLLYGPLHDARPKPDRKEVGKRYYKNVKTGRYDVKGKKQELVYKGSDKVFFPRMYSPDGNHVIMYKKWVGDDYRKPNMGHNIKYYFRYQLGYMYWRYFMWNFAGRQDDVQGTVDNKSIHGNWLTGIPFIDSFRLGSQEGIPDVIRDQKARNTYYLLPFIFGILGLIFLFRNNQRWAFVFLLLFVLTGIMLNVYFNSPPREPRERDYTLVGSFLTYCIFIGIGVLFLYDLIKRTMPRNASAVLATIIGLAAVPTIMGFNGFDDHNRNQRKMARDFASNFLESCPPNAILFTQGDNDTYPLWYVQEVEGVRPDVRVANLSLIGVDWYIEYLQRAANENGPVPFYSEFNVDKYMGDKRNQVFYQNKGEAGKFYDFQSIMNFILSDEDAKQVTVSSGQKANYFPAKKVKLTVDREAVLANNVVPEEYQDRIVDEITWKLPMKGQGPNKYVMKNDVALLAIIAAADWSRPICFANTVAPSSYNGLGKYLIQEGMMYRFIPVKFPQNSPGTSSMALNAEAMYENVMEKYLYGNLEKKEHFIDENTHRMMHGLRNVHIALARELARDGEKEKSVAVLERIKEKFPDMNTKYYSPYNNYYNHQTIQWIELYYANDASDLAQEIIDTTLVELIDCWRFYNSTTTFAENFQGDPSNQLLWKNREYAASNIQQLMSIAITYSDEDLYSRLAEAFPQVQAPRAKPLDPELKNE